MMARYTWWARVHSDHARTRCCTRMIPWKKSRCDTIILVSGSGLELMTRALTRERVRPITYWECTCKTTTIIPAKRTKDECHLRRSELGPTCHWCSRPYSLLLVTSRFFVACLFSCGLAYSSRPACRPNSIGKLGFRKIVWIVIQTIFLERGVL
jgi:hypothetical protein